MRSYLASFATRDPERIAGHVAQGFVNEHTSALGDGCVGRDSYCERLPGFLGAFPGLRYDVEDMVVEGERVVAAYRLTAEHDGHRVDLRGVMRFEVSDGQISRRVDYWDSLVFLRQTGQA